MTATVDAMVQDFLTLTEGHMTLAPKTRSKAAEIVGQWAEFLKDNKIRNDRVQVEHYRAFGKHLLDRGLKLSSINVYLSYVKMYYAHLADAKPHSRWPHFLAQLNSQKRAKVRRSTSPHEPLPLEVMPDVLETAREYGGDEYALVAGFLYSGMRAQMIGLRVEDVRFGEGIIRTRVKGGHEVPVPLHDRLAEIWKQHLKERDYETPMLFEWGRYPYNYMTDNGDAEKDPAAIDRNQAHVRRMLGRVERRLKEKGIDVHLTSHRFRKAVGTYGPEFGMDSTDMRVLLSHAAKSITDQYDRRDIQKVRAKWNRVDPGSREWVDAHKDGQPVLNGDDGKMALVDRLLSLSEGKLEALLELVGA